MSFRKGFRYLSLSNSHDSLWHFSVLLLLSFGCATVTVLVFSTGRNYSHNGRISLDKSLSANKQKGVTRATKLCATLKDGLSPPWRSWVLTCVHCSCPSYSIQPKPGWPRRSFALFLVQVDSTTKGAEAPVDTLKFHDGNQNAGKFTACSHYPCHLSFAIRSISLGVDCRRVKDSLTLLSLAVRPPVCSLQLPAPAHSWVVFIRKNETHAESGGTFLKFFRRFRLIKSPRKASQKIGRWSGDPPHSSRPVRLVTAQR